MQNLWKTLKTKDLSVNIYQNGNWGSYVHQHLQTSIDSTWIETDNAHVNVLNRGDLSSLTWLQSPVITTTNVNDPNFDTCTVHYASLNFRDIMLGKIIFEIKLHKNHPINSLGKTKRNRWVQCKLFSHVGNDDCDLKICSHLFFIMYKKPVYLFKINFIFLNFFPSLLLVGH